jgi:hypothetical protein
MIMLPPRAGVKYSPTVDTEDCLVEEDDRLEICFTMDLSASMGISDPTTEEKDDEREVRLDAAKAGL